MSNTPVNFEVEQETSGGVPGIEINFKRVIGRAIAWWYFILLSILLSLTVAYLVNRYSTRIYPVSASILIKENEENVGAKFLYNNELLNPYRNFYNELYILKSYPLVQEVIESLGFDISLFREGDVKTTEYYDTNFPVRFHFVKGKKKSYGQSFYFTIKNDRSYIVENISESEDSPEEQLRPVNFGDTINVIGADFYAQLVGDPTDLKDKRFILRVNNPIHVAQSYAGKLKAEWAQVGASVVNLEINGTIAEKEIDFLNKFIERYQYYDVEKKNLVANMAINFLEEQLLLIGDSLNRYEDQVENFKKRNVTTDIGQETSRLYQQMQTFEEQKIQYQLLENYFDYISNLLKSDNYDGIFTPTSVGITDAVIATLINELIEARTEVNLYRSAAVNGVERFRDNPRLKTAENRIQQLKLDILKTIDNTRKTQKINIAFIGNQVKEIQKQLARLPQTERELINIQRNYSLKENLYVILLQKRTEAGLSKASTTSDIMVVNPPYAKGPISPKVDQNYAIAGGVGLVLPFLLIILLEILNNRIQSKEDILKITDVPIIGGVGHNNVSDPLVVYKKPRSAMAESFRSLRANLNYFTGNKDHQIFMITSSIPGEGKSFTTLNLACVFALAGKKTVIVGADLRRPKLFDDLGLHNDFGLSQYLSGMATLDQILQKTTIEHLSLITGGPMPPNPSELLLKAELPALLDQLKKDFDFVIMDTPPLALVTDAFILSNYADHSLFVVRQNYTPKSALRALAEFYESNKLVRVSLLFNDVQKTGLGYGYDYNYGYGYNYGYHYGSLKGSKAGGEYYHD